MTWAWSIGFIACLLVLAHLLTKLVEWRTDMYQQINRLRWSEQQAWTEALASEQEISRVLDRSHDLATKNLELAKENAHLRATVNAYRSQMEAEADGLE